MQLNVFLAVAFDSIFRYIEDIINNDFHSYADSIYHNKPEIKDTTVSFKCAFCLDILLSIDINGKLTTEHNTGRFQLPDRKLLILNYVAIFHCHLHMVCMSLT